MSLPSRPTSKGLQFERGEYNFRKLIGWIVGLLSQMVSCLIDLCLHINKCCVCSIRKRRISLFFSSSLVCNICEKLTYSEIYNVSKQGLKASSMSSLSKLKPQLSWRICKILKLAPDINKRILPKQISISSTTRLQRIHFQGRRHEAEL